MRVFDKKLDYSAKVKVQSVSPHPGHLKPSSGKSSSSNSWPHLSHFHFSLINYI